MHLFHLSVIRRRLDGHLNLKHIAVLLVGRRKRQGVGQGGGGGGGSGTEN